jgi:hypothetical protein
LEEGKDIYIYRWVSTNAYLPMFWIVFCVTRLV